MLIEQKKLQVARAEKQRQQLVLNKEKALMKDIQAAESRRELEHAAVLKVQLQKLRDLKKEKLAKEMAEKERKGAENAVVDKRKYNNHADKDSDDDDDDDDDPKVAEEIKPEDDAALANVDEDTVDFIQVNASIEASIPDILELQQVQFGRRALRALWLVFLQKGDTDRDNIFGNPRRQKKFIVPISCGVTAADPWILIDSKAIDISSNQLSENVGTNDSKAEQKTLDEKRKVVCQTLQRCLTTAGTRIPRYLQWSPTLFDLSNFFDQMCDVEQFEFIPMDGTQKMIYVKLAEGARAMSSLSQPPPSTDVALAEKQSDAPDGRSRYEQFVVKQIKNIVVKPTPGQKAVVLDAKMSVNSLISEFFETVQQLSTTAKEKNVDLLEDLSLVWAEKLDSIDRLIQEGGAKMYNSIKRLLNELQSATGESLEQLELMEIKQQAPFQQLKLLFLDALKEYHSNDSKYGSKETPAKLDMINILSSFRFMQSQLIPHIQIDDINTHSSLSLGIQEREGVLGAQSTRRVFPTTFIFVDQNEVSNSNGYEKWLSIFEMLRSLPIQSLQQSIESKLQVDEHVALLCEACFTPAGQFPFYAINRNSVLSILPLAKAALRTALKANNLSGFRNRNVLGSSEANFPKHLEAIQAHFKNDSSNYVEEQRKVEKLAKTLYTMNNKSDNNTTTWAPYSAAALGFCAKEFRRFLLRVDSTGGWCGLRARLSSEGQVVFVCQYCHQD